eukprot:XP_764538.1 hypothetical protein [Theileria parva strain Muguga]
MDYEGILDKTRVFSDKNLLELTKEDVETYLSFLGYTKSPKPCQKSSEIAESGNEVKNILFFLLCKLLQDYSNYLSPKKVNKNGKEELKKELKSHHYDLFRCLILNIEKRTKLSVYNPVFLKLIHFNINEREVNLKEDDLETCEEKLRSILHLTSALYFNYGSQIHNKNEIIAFSSNELNELTELLLTDITIFENLLNRSGNLSENDLKPLVKTLSVILKRIEVLFRVIKFTNKPINTKFLNQLFVFIYHLDQFKKINSKVMNTSEKCIENTTNGLGEIEENIFEVIKGNVEDNVIHLMNNFSNEDNVEKEKETVKNEKTYGFFLLLPKIVENIPENQETIKTICSKLMSYVTEFPQKDDKTSNPQVTLIAIKSYYNILLVVKDKTFLLSVVTESMEFIFGQLFRFYEQFASSNSNHRERNNKRQSKLLKEELDYYWKLLTVVSNVKLELVDQNMEKLFELLKKDFQIFSTNLLGKKTLSLLNDISCNYKPKQNDDSEVDRFLKNLVLQYNSISQLSSIFKYIHLNSKNRQNEDVEDMEIGGERVQKRKLIIYKDTVKTNSGKKLKTSENDLNGVKHDANEKSGVQKPFEINHLNNYSILKAINELEVNSIEIMENLKIMEEFDMELHTIVVVYLSRVEFNTLNVSKLAKQFVLFCSKISVSDDVVGLSLLLQLIRVSRKLLSLLSPQVDPTEVLEDSEDKFLENEQDLIKSLLIVIYNVYVYVKENFDTSKNEMIMLNILYNIMLVNNEQFKVAADFYHKNDKTQEITPKESGLRLFKMEIEQLLTKLLSNCTSKEVAGFILTRIKLFECENLKEKLCNLSSPELSEYYPNLNKETSMYCFKKLITDKKINNEKLRNIGSLLDNIVGRDNEEVVDILLTNINTKFRKLASPSSVFVERITILMELLLFVLNYEFPLNVSKTCKAVVCNAKNVFDIIVWLKTVVDSGEKMKIVKMFSKYYSIFTEYICKYSGTVNGAESSDKDDCGLKNTCVLVNNLLLNYLKKRENGSKTGNETSESGNEDGEYWEVYFLYEYIKCLKIKNVDIYNKLSLSTILREAIISYFNSRNSDSHPDKELGNLVVKQDDIELVFKNVDLIDNKKFQFKADCDGDKLYKLIMCVIKSLKIRCSSSVSKEIDELNRFLKDNTDLNNELILITLDHLIERDENTPIFQTIDCRNELILLLSLINASKDENLYLFERIIELLNKHQDYINKSAEDNFSKSVEDNLILNYVIVYKLNQRTVPDKVKDNILKLVQIILKIINKIKGDSERRDYCNMLLKLINVLVGSVSKNIDLLIYFYYQFNHYVVNTSHTGDDWKFLIRFTTSIINYNTVKYIKSYVPLLLTVAVNTLYELEKSSEKRFLNAREVKILRKCIVKHIKTTASKARIYKLLKNEIKPFFKEMVSR